MVFRPVPALPEAPIHGSQRTLGSFPALSSSFFDSARRGLAALATTALVLGTAGCGDDGEPVEVDVTPPQVTVSSQELDGAVLTVTVAVSDDGTIAEVAWRLGDGAETPVTFTGSPVTFQVEGIPFGTSQLTVLARDEAGNEGSASVQVSRDDQVAPALTLEAPGDSSVFATGTVLLSGEASDANGVDRLEWSAGEAASGTVELDGGSSVSFEEELELPDGMHQLTVSGVDLAGNATERSRQVTVDSRAPTVGAAELADGAMVRADTLRFRLVAEDSVGLSSVAWSVDGGSFTTEEVERSLGVEQEVTLTDLAAGGHELTLRATDVAGNRAETTLSVTADATDPVLDGVELPSGSVVADGSVTLELSVPSPDDIHRITVLVDGEELRELFQREDASGASGGGPAKVQTEGGFRFEVGDLGPGTHELVVCLYDAAGNPTCTTVEVTVDDAAPSVSISSPVQGETLPGTSVVLEAEASDPSGLDFVRWRVDQGGWNPVRTPDTVVSISNPLDPLSPGDHTVMVEALDPADNVGRDTVDFVTTGTVAPPDTADLSVTVAVDSPAVAGQSVALTSTVSNDGPHTAQNVILTDSLPASLGLASSACTANGPLVTCMLGELAAGADTTVDLTLNALSPDTAQVAATVGASTVDPDGSDDRAAAGVVIEASVGAGDTADLSLTLDVESPADVGDTLDVTATVSNAGPHPASGVAVAGTLPPSLVFLPTSLCSIAGTEVACSLNGFAANGDTTLALRARALETDTARAFARVSAVTTDPDTVNNVDTTDVLVRGPGSAPPTVLITSPADSSVATSAQITVEGAATDDLGVDSLTWQLDAGAQTELGGTPADSVPFSFQPTLSEGFNRIVVRAWDAADQMAADTVDVDHAEPPTASFGTGGSTTAGEATTFDASGSSDPQGRPLSHQWRFGDGDRGSARTLAHVYDAAGTYDVTLVVTNDAGLSDSTSTQVSISAPPPPTATDGTVNGVVLDQSGDSLSGVTVTHPGTGTSGTTDTSGEVTLQNLPVGPSLVLELTSAGFVDNQVSVTIPGGADGFFQARMVATGATTSLPDAEDGGDVTGDDGARIELPDSALVDENGDPVTGAVDVTTTGVDVSSDEIEAFPGGFGAVDSTGTSGVLKSYGVVDFSLTQGSQQLDLADGKTATIEIPIYTSGASVGQTIPLWSLDESAGVWVQEGTGTVVSSGSTPTGLALRAEIGHLSWFNCDAFFNPFTPTIQLSGPGGPVPGRITATSSGSGPRSSASAGISSGGTSLPFAPNTEFVVNASADNGLLTGDTTVSGPAGGTGTITILVESITISAPDTLRRGDSIQAAIDPAGEEDEYAVVGPDGSFAQIRAKSASGSTLEGDIALLDALGDTLGSASFFESFGARPARLVAALTSEARVLTVDGTGNEPGVYDVIVSVPEALPLHVEDTTEIREGESVAYSVDASGMDSIRVIQSGSQPDFSNFDGACLSIRLEGGSGSTPLDHTLQCSSSGTDERLDTVIPLPQPGGHALILENLAEVFYASTIRVTTASPPDTLSLGDSIRGRIDPEGDIDEYALVGTPGEYVSVRATTRNVSSGVTADAVLYGTTGDTLAVERVEGGFSPEDAELFTRIETDPQRVSVNGTFDEPGDYDIVVERPDTLELQERRRDPIEAGARTGYLFNSGGFDSIRVQQDQTSGFQTDCVTMEVAQVGGPEVVSATVPCGQSLDTLLALPGQGSYVLWVRNELDDRFNSDVVVEGWDPVVAAIDTTVTDSLRFGKRQFYAFDAQAGDTLGLGHRGSNFDGELILLDEGRDPVTGSFEFRDVWVIPADGTYYVQVTEHASFSFSGFRSFDVGISRIPIEPLQLSRDVVQDTIRRPGDLHFYTFTAPDSAGFTALLESAAGLPGGTMRGGIIGTDSLLDPGTGNGDLDNSPSFLVGDRIAEYQELLVPEAGSDTYVLAVESFSQDTGPYTLTADLAQRSADITVDDDLSCAGADVRSFRAALLAVRAGGTLTLCPGIYDGAGQAEVLVDSLAIRGTDPTGSVVRGNHSRALRVDGHRGLTLDSLTMEARSGSDVVSMNDATGATLRELTIRPEAGHGPVSSGILVDGDSVTIRDATVTGAQTGIETSPASFFTVTGSRVEAESFGIDLNGGHDILIRHDTVQVSNSHGNGVSHATSQFTQDGGAVTVDSSQITLLDGGTAVRVEENGAGATGSVVRDNTIDIQGGGGVIDLQAFFIEEGVTSDTVLVERNRITMNNSQGGQFMRVFPGRTDGDPGTVIARSNTVDGVGFESIRLEDMQRWDAVEFYNNTFEAAATSFVNQMPIFVVNEFESPQGQLPVDIVNNIFVGHPGQDYVAITGNSGDTVRADHNLFYDLDVGAYDGGITSSLAGGGSAPLGANSITGQDPLLDGMLNLGAGSPAIDAGTGDTGLFPGLPGTDVDGAARPQGGGYDIGADEGG